MRALVIADRCPDVPVETVLGEEHVDLVVTLGDLLAGEIHAVTRFDGPRIGVYGNHCDGRYLDALGIQNLHLSTTVIDGIRFGGFEGCVRYKPFGNLMYDQTEAARMLEGFPQVDVMVSHCPPFGINHEPESHAHAGFHGLRRLLDDRPPGVWLHGHTYPRPDELVTRHGPTRIEYVNGHRLIHL